MTLVYTHENLLLVMNINSVLEQAGIKTQVKNTFSAGGRGEIPVFETWPEVWVHYSNQVERAKQLVAEITSKQEKEDWYCSSCGETNGYSFDFCWQCEQEKPRGYE